MAIWWKCLRVNNHKLFRKSLNKNFRLNFPNQDEAQNFSKFMKRALDDVLGRVPFEDTDVYRPQASVASLHSTTSNHVTNQRSSQQPEPTHFTPTIAASSSSNRNGLGFDRIQITDRNYARKWSKYILILFLSRLNSQKSQNCHFWEKNTKIIARVNFGIFMNSPYIFNFSWKLSERPFPAKFRKSYIGRIR